MSDTSDEHDNVTLATQSTFWRFFRGLYNAGQVAFVWGVGWTVMRGAQAPNMGGTAPSDTTAVLMPSGPASSSIVEAHADPRGDQTRLDAGNNRHQEVPHACCLAPASATRPVVPNFQRVGEQDRALEAHRLEMRQQARSNRPPRLQKPPQQHRGSVRGGKPFGRKLHR